MNIELLKQFSKKVALKFFPRTLPKFPIQPKFPVRSYLAIVLLGAVVVVVMGGCTALLQKNPPPDKSPFNSADIEVVFNEEKVPQEHITISRTKLIVTGLTNVYDNLQAKGKITISERSTAFNAFPLSIGFDDPTGIASKSQSLLEAFMLVPAEGREQEMDILIDFSGVAVKELISADLFSATYGPSESALVISPTTPPQAGVIEVDNAGNKIIINGFTNLSDGAAGLFKVIELPEGYTSSELVINDPPSIDAITTNIGKIIIAEGTDTSNPVNGNSETYEVVARFFDTSALGNKDITVVYNGKESDPNDIDVDIANGVVTITNLTNAYTHLNAEVNITIEDDLRPFSVMPRTVTISDPPGITNISVTNRGQFTIVPADGNAFLMDVVTHFKGIPVAELITATSFEGSFNANNPLPSRIFQTGANAFAVKFTNVIDGVAGTFSFKDQATPEPPTPPVQYLPAGYVYEVNQVTPPSPTTLPIAITDPDGTGIAEVLNHGLYTITVAEGSIAAPTEGNSETYTMHIHFKPLIEIFNVAGTIVAFNTPTPHTGTLDENYVAYFPLSLTNASCREYAPEVTFKVGGSENHGYTIGTPAPAINHYFDEVVAANNIKTDAQELRITEADGDVTIYTLTPTIQECMLTDPVATGNPATILGAGTSGNPWQIDNDMKLDLISRTINDVTSLPSPHKDDHYELTRAIDLGIAEAPWSDRSQHANPRAYGFTPIGSTLLAMDELNGLPQFDNRNHTNNFSGNFNCDNHEISNLFISNAVSSGETNGNVKGLFAHVNTGGSISNCHLISPHVTGYGRAGSLVGILNGTSKVINSSAQNGRVMAVRIIAGGLVGVAGGTTEISNSYATVAVSVGARATGAAGGLIGELGGGTVTDSYATGVVTARDFTGGLVGLGSGGELINTYATGAVAGTGDVGGLVGKAAYGGNMTISNSYATGNVNGSVNVGGLVGDVHFSGGTITRSYATGAVTGRLGNTSVGGLVGRNTGVIDNSYATGNVSGATNVGGFVGYNILSISNSYATGAVSGTASVGGFNGSNDSGPGAVITASYWDTDTSGLTASDGGTGRTTAQLQVANPIPSGSDAVYVGWDTTMIWQLRSGAYPQLR
ncbi:hypothetical protein COTS27_00807 [Spirochaetota bacterium]|nr:hypothetical protein COTS27_00807 [Spirochaetota bacterium]